MNIVIDLDNTLFYNDIVDKACEDAGIDRTFHHDLHDLPQDVQDTCWETFKNVDRMCSLKPLDGAVGIDKILKDAGHNVLVVSSRSVNLYDKTHAMVKKYFPYVDDVVLLESFDKTSEYVKLQADVVIDDHYDHVLQARDAKVKHVFMVTSDNTQYNHLHIQDALDNGIAVTSSVKCLQMFADGCMDGE